MRNMVLTENQPENLGGAKKREEMPAHNIVLPPSQNPSCWNPSWLRGAHTTRQDPESDQMWARAR